MQKSVNFHTFTQKDQDFCILFSYALPITLWQQKHLHVPWGNKQTFTVKKHSAIWSSKRSLGHFLPPQTGEQQGNLMACLSWPVDILTQSRTNKIINADLYQQVGWYYFMGNTTKWPVWTDRSPVCNSPGDQFVCNPSKDHFISSTLFKYLLMSIHAAPHPLFCAKWKYKCTCIHIYEYMYIHNNEYMYIHNNIIIITQYVSNFEK